MRLVILLPWIAATSFAAFAGAVAFAVVADIYFPRAFGYPGTNVLSSFRLIFPMILGACALVGIPIATSHLVGRPAGFLAAIVALVVGFVLVVWTVLSRETLEVVVFGLAIVVSSLVVSAPSFALILWLFGFPKTPRYPPPLLGRGGLWASVVIAVALLPLVPFAIRDGSTDRMCRSISQNQQARVYYKGEITFNARAADWPEFKLLLERFGSSHGMAFAGPDPWNLRSSPRDAHLCSPGKLVISSDAFRGDPPYWSIWIGVYAPGGDWEPSVRELVALIRSQWAHVRLNDGLQKSLQQP